MSTEDSGRPAVSQMVEDIVGCKWSLQVLATIRAGTRRPGALEAAVPGISTKVLNERLRKLTRYGILEREVFPEVPPRVEYRFTAFGEQFSGLLGAVEDLDRRLAAGEFGRPSPD